MNSSHHKVTQRGQEELHSEARQQTQSQTGLEFQTPEEALRHDRAQTVVPDTVARRLNDSVAALPKRERRWWRRILG